MAKDPADPHNLHATKDAVLQTVLIATEGAHRGDSAERVEQVLRGKPGVVEVQADPGIARVKVTFDPSKTDVPALHEALQSAGYKPSPVSDEDRTEE